jgi:hypothetical protein
VVPVLIERVVQPVHLAAPSKKEVPADQLNHEQKNLIGLKVLQMSWATALVVHQRETLLQTTGGLQVFVVMRLTLILASLHLHQSRQEKKLYPSAKTSSNLAYFPTVPDSMQ